ncbi:hypothetical protein [Hyphobacterium marinum]|uniref:DUF2268 domain-containing protein n=1 Tax=Hyphobacterium marinum TaxID=3116574 RepID=A0ABU7LZ04_9PROT|nr:hypothetical protein [Hyphobacterium sp. Y6023]MEE2566235.1 hypothetical protein [Hyphobacterium sp. Y6023]
MTRTRLALATALLAAASLSHPASAQGVDPETVELQTADAHRFVAVYEAANGLPSAEVLQAGYLDGAGRGVEIFTPYRIQNAENLAAVIAANTGAYRRAIDVCLPIGESMTPELRATYLRLAELLPGRDLPEIYLVFGAGNSGGTAGEGAQVLGLEVLCAQAGDEAEIRRVFQHFFAHETVHTLQDQPGGLDDLLLAHSLHEGVADFIAFLTTGEIPTPEREAWARENEDTVWAAFARDRATVAAGTTLTENGPDLNEAANAARRNWVMNYQNAPEGWPHEAGYWIGRQIAQAYYDRAADKPAALASLLSISDPGAILEASGVADRATLTEANE